MIKKESPCQDESQQGKKDENDLVAMSMDYIRRTVNNFESNYEFLKKSNAGSELKDLRLERKRLMAFQLEQCEKFRKYVEDSIISLKSAESLSRTLYKILVCKRSGELRL